MDIRDYKTFHNTETGAGQLAPDLLFPARWNTADCSDTRFAWILLLIKQESTWVRYNLVLPPFQTHPIRHVSLCRGTSNTLPYSTVLYPNSPHHFTVRPGHTTLTTHITLPTPGPTLPNSTRTNSLITGPGQIRIRIVTGDTFKWQSFTRTCDEES